MSDSHADFLIVGAGPAGASLACFLAEYGLSGVMIAAAPSTADTPRAHITNMAALECLRDIGLDEECLQNATSSGNMEHTRWCHTMAGDEYARIHSWGHDPNRHGEYYAASPCDHVDLPQTLLEPILLSRAKQGGWDVRFDTSFDSYTLLESGDINCRVRDGSSGKTYTITTKYLLGCDGARSQVMRQLGIPLIKKPGGGLAFNVLVDVDLSHLVKSRMGNLHWIIQPERDPPPHLWMSMARMVRPWSRWIFIMFPRADYDPAVHGEPDEALWEKEVQYQIGDDSIPFKIVNTSKWAVNEVIAERYSEGNIFCLGDAVHRHPPFNGLGSNTCIQDSYNLAWKLALVHSSLAHPSLLSTYSLERQPVGYGVITRANQGFRDHLHIWNALGMTTPDLATRMSQFDELKSPTKAGRARREALKSAIEGTAHEFHAVGQEMNQRYDSTAIHVGDEMGPRPTLPDDPVLTLQVSTYPGARLPHVWLNTRTPGTKFSTQDIAGHGAFCLITGIGGDGWKVAAEKMSNELGIKINSYAIGWCQDFEDVYSDWSRRREVDEDGCVLVRPDRFVCWRAMCCPPNTDECEKMLGRALKCILGREKHPAEAIITNGDHDVLEVNGTHS